VTQTASHALAGIDELLAEIREGRPVIVVLRMV
jgi:hypothetical protein